MTFYLGIPPPSPMQLTSLFLVKSQLVVLIIMIYKYCLLISQIVYQDFIYIWNIYVKYIYEIYTYYIFHIYICKILFFLEFLIGSFFNLYNLLLINFNCFQMFIVSVVLSNFLFFESFLFQSPQSFSSRVNSVFYGFILRWFWFFCDGFLLSFSYIHHPFLFLFISFARVHSFMGLPKKKKKKNLLGKFSSYLHLFIFIYIWLMAIGFRMLG